MLYKKLNLFTCFFFASCLAMSDGQKWQLLSTSAQPIHTFLTKNLNDKNAHINQKELDNFTKEFKALDVAPSILCILADRRAQSGEYHYVCPQGFTYKIEYYMTDGKTKRESIINQQNNANIWGIPLVAYITQHAGENGHIEKETINFIDEDHTWTPSLFGCNRSYNLIRLLFDCNQIDAAQQILSANDRPMGFNLQVNTRNSFLALQARYNKDSKTSQNEKDIIAQLSNRLSHDVDPEECNCCLTGCQVCCVCFMMFATRDGMGARHSIKGLKFIAGAATLTMEAIKQGTQYGRKHSDLGKYKLKKD